MNAEDHSHDDHDHAGHDHTAGAGAVALAQAFALTLGFLLFEILGAWWYSSLALLSDAAHMFTDCAALAIALAAQKISTFAADSRRTYGYRRFEVLAAAFNASLLTLAAIWIFIEAVRRFFEPTAVQAIGMMAIAFAGLLANGAGMWLLRRHQTGNLNMKGAYLELWADAVGSIGVIIGGALIWATGLTWIDPLVAVAIALWVLPRTWSLLRTATHILMQGVPSGINLAEIRGKLAAVEGVGSVHDLHIWSVAGDDISLTAHIVLAPGFDHEEVRAAVVQALGAEFDGKHITLQTEELDCSQAALLHA